METLESVQDTMSLFLEPRERQEGVRESIHQPHVLRGQNPQARFYDGQSSLTLPSLTQQEGQWELDISHNVGQNLPP